MKVDTNEMRNIAGEISELANQYQTKISMMYSKFTNMPGETREWTGGRAQDYVNLILLDKPDIMMVGDRIKDFARTITDSANLLDRTDAIVRKDEADD